MRKSASQIADEVLEKCGFGRVEAGLVGGLGLLGAGMAYGGYKMHQKQKANNAELAKYRQQAPQQAQPKVPQR